MKQLHALVEQQVRGHLNVSPEEFDYLTHPSPSHLHDPFYYRDMRELVGYLHAFKKKQEKDLWLLLAVDGDYDTDGICAATILTAALSVFGFRFRVYMPSMADGYGLSRTAIDQMKSNLEADGDRIGMILTADNGANAFSGIAYANSLHIDVLVTDHHPAKERVPNAKALVDPNRPDDLYPFKGNSGACVAWKVMLAYAELFAKDKKPLIERLIVFAGLSNVADVMPIRNENRYMVTAAMEIIKELVKIPDVPKPDYKAMANTPYPAYNAVFHGLYDLIKQLQAHQDEKRDRRKKSRIPLPMNEELFSWYLSPMLNAPRRVHDTCREGLCAFLVSDPDIRKYLIGCLINLNEEKSKLRDRVLQAIPEDLPDTVLCVNTRKGISGLIAASLAEKTQLPSVVFSCYDPENEVVLYETPPAGRLSGSARSNPEYPLDRIMDKLNERHPGLVTGGGHVTGAGFSIDSQNFNTFKQLFQEVLPEVKEEALARQSVVEVPPNEITLYAIHPAILIAETITPSENGLVATRQELNTNTFARDALSTVAFLESLRPFGSDFCYETQFRLVFDKSVYAMDWNPDFWKTFKFSLYGVEVLTFDAGWAKEVKALLEAGERVIALGKLKINEFRGRTTPQLILNTAD